MGRASFQSINAIIGHDSELGETASAAAKARVVGVPSKRLSEGKMRYERWLEDDEEFLFVLRGAIRKDKMPREWVDFIQSMWVDEQCTREGGGSKDVCRNPKDRSDTELYRICWLEKPFYKIVEIMQTEGGKIFLPDHRYEDGEERKFNIASSHGKYIAVLRPFRVKQKGRDLCLCWRHLQWDLLAAGLYNWRKEVTTKKLAEGCSCENIRSGYTLLKLLLCDKPTGSEYHKPECLAGTCSECGDCKNIPFCAECRKVQKEVRFMQRVKVKKKTAKGKVTEKYDFDKAEMSVQDFEAHFKVVFKGFADHHTDVKCQTQDWKHCQVYFPRGSFSSVQDFSENLTIEVKLEHQSKYYRSVVWFCTVCLFLFL